MIFDFEVGDFVRHPARPDWGDSQVQSIIGQVVTVNFEDDGKQNKKAAFFFTFFLIYNYLNDVLDGLK